MTRVSNQNAVRVIISKADGLEETTIFDGSSRDGSVNRSNESLPGSKTKRFFKKYFLEGQSLNPDQEKAISELKPDASWTDIILVKHRKLVGMFIPLILVHVLWWPIAIKWDFFNRFYPARFAMTITMCFGSTVAGATSEGGGSVAYPVMTLALGMTSATFTIFWMKIKIDWYSIIYSTFGATFGIIFGFEVIDHLLTPPQKKLGFTSIWFAFAIALLILNRHQRKTFDTVPDFKPWKGAVLIATGFLGGIFSAICGVGVDICSFSVLCLLFRVSEKVATPTSIVLMAANTLTGFYWRQLMTANGAEPIAWEYLAVAIPVAVIFAPLGAFLSSHFNRMVFATFVYLVDTIGLITAYSVISMTWQLGVMSVCLIFGSFGIFFTLSKLGERLLRLKEEKDLQLPQ